MDSFERYLTDIIKKYDEFTYLDRIKYWDFSDVVSDVEDFNENNKTSILSTKSNKIQIKSRQSRNSNNKSFNMNCLKYEDSYKQNITEPLIKILCGKISNKNLYEKEDKIQLSNLNRKSISKENYKNISFSNELNKTNLNNELIQSRAVYKKINENTIEPNIEQKGHIENNEKERNLKYKFSNSVSKPINLNTHTGNTNSMVFPRREEVFSYLGIGARPLYDKNFLKRNDRCVTRLQKEKISSKKFGMENNRILQKKSSALERSGVRGVKFKRKKKTLPKRKLFFSSFEQLKICKSSRLCNRVTTTNKLEKFRSKNVEENYISNQKVIKHSSELLKNNKEFNKEKSLKKFSKNKIERININKSVGNDLLQSWTTYKNSEIKTTGTKEFISDISNNFKNKNIEYLRLEEESKINFSAAIIYNKFLKNLEEMYRRPRNPSIAIQREKSNTNSELVNSTKKDSSVLSHKYRRNTTTKVSVATNTNISAFKTKTVATNTPVVNTKDCGVNADRKILKFKSKKLYSKILKNKDFIKYLIKNRSQLPEELRKTCVVRANKIKPKKVMNAQTLFNCETMQPLTDKEFSNPLDIIDGKVLHIYYEQEYLIVIQEYNISFWKYSKTEVLKKKSQNWILLGKLKRNIFDIEVSAPYRNRLGLNDVNPFYIEIRAHQFGKDCYRKSQMAAVRINIYYYIVKDNRVKMNTIDLDTIYGLAADITYTSILNSRYFIMKWKQEYALNTIKTGICKYALVPNLDTFASIREFPLINYDINSLECLEEDKLVGLSSTKVMMWNHHSGDVLLNLDFEANAEMVKNLGAVIITENALKYIILYKLKRIHNSATECSSKNAGNVKAHTSVLEVLKISIDQSIQKNQLIVSHKLPEKFENITSSFSNENCFIAISDNNNEIFILPEQPYQIRFVENKHTNGQFNKIKNNLIKKFYSTGSKHFVELSSKTLNVKKV